MFLKKIKQALKIDKPNETIPEKPQTISLWEDTGKVFYIENTLKLTYESNSGSITLEKLSMQALPDLINNISLLPENSPLAIKNTANQKSAFNISLCGVTWQKNTNATRIKAIADAALLRSQTACFSKSQAIFRHATLLEHDDLLTSSLIQPKAGQFIYNRITVEQFTQQIKIANKRISEDLRKKVLINQDNFDSPFTEHESEEIERLIDINLQKKIT
ncbi:hypothetical protein CWB73_12225 [Pseudoalteromonas phenolica]|uniref:Uncharacterized protein n=1 Tax=Pseudoalteromonas phenolica TaxID=161398 RepID=A0A5S3YSC5_9GAMM|nr:hypothetical protein [Pseudoalteromonas phenolica]TMP80038.1 hypothetical protein CWB73_12225 [Pseudoalteromonas phenolica]